MSLCTHTSHTCVCARACARACETLWSNGFKVKSLSVSVSSFRSLICDAVINANFSLPTRLPSLRIGSLSQGIRYEVVVSADVTRP